MVKILIRAGISDLRMPRMVPDNSSLAPLRHWNIATYSTRWQATSITAGSFVNIETKVVLKMVITAARRKVPTVPITKQIRLILLQRLILFTA